MTKAEGEENGAKRLTCVLNPSTSAYSACHYVHAASSLRLLAANTFPFHVYVPRSTAVQREKVECIASAIRTHFLHHLRASSLETAQLTAETDSVLASLDSGAAAAAANLSGVKGALLVMKALGEAKAGKAQKKKGRSAKAPPAALGSPGGIGGIAVSAEPTGESILGVKDCAVPLSSSWLLPGDAVRTCYGAGVVDAIMGDYTLKEKQAGAGAGAGPQQTGLVVVPPRVKIKVSVCVCVCVCERERERKGERGVSEVSTFRKSPPLALTTPVTDHRSTTASSTWSPLRSSP